MLNIVINSKITNKSIKNSKIRISSSNFSNNKKKTLCSLYVQSFNMVINVAALFPLKMIMIYLDCLLHGSLVGD